MNQTNIRIDQDQAKRSKKLRAAAKGAQIRGLAFKHRKPTHSEIYQMGLETLDSEMKKAK